MNLKVGNRYWFWNIQEDRACRITITELTPTDFAFSFAGRRGRCSYDAVEGQLYENKWDMPQFRHLNDGEEVDEETEFGYDNLVGFEHGDLSGTGYKYYPSIYWYQGSNDYLAYGSVYDVEDYYDSGLD